MKRRVPARIAAPKHVRVAVDDDYRIIHNHAEHNDERGKGHGVQLDTEDVHQPHSDGSADRNAGAGHEGRAQREKEQHHRDDYEDGEEQVAQERHHRLIDHVGLVGDLVHIDIRRKSVLALRYLLLHPLAESHDVVAGSHLHGNQHRGTAVVFDVTGWVGIAALNGGDIAQSHVMPQRVGEDNLLTNLIFRLIRNGNMHLGLTVFVLHTAAHGAYALRGEFHQQGPLADAVGR